MGSDPFFARGLREGGGSQRSGTRRAPGFEMIVRSDGRTEGTWAERGRSRGDPSGPRGLARGRCRRFVRDFAPPSGLLCGGSAEILLEPVPDTAENRTLLDHLIEASKQPGARVLTWLPEDIGGTARFAGGDGREAFVFDLRGFRTRPAFLTPRPWQAFRVFWRRAVSRSSWSPRGRATASFSSEPAMSPWRSPTRTESGFVVVVIDDRAEFANRGRFPGADEVCVVPCFKGPSRRFPRTRTPASSSSHGARARPRRSGAGASDTRGTSG